MKNKNNLLEARQGIVHANSGDGDDHTLCGVDAQNIIEDESLYDSSEDSDMCPTMIRTGEKINCIRCAAIIRHCVKLGVKSIASQLKEYDFPEDDF